ncbi:MAG: hypothetical protein ACTHXA_08365 [Gulosibacter sp.]|uniref:hypothetical protein n=1 Tax=Gulosibacter sp. TaxID=2817531 RepID=UPI003F9098E6
MLLERSTERDRDARPRAGDVISGWRLVRPLRPDNSEFVGVSEIVGYERAQGSEHWAAFASPAQPHLEHRRIRVAVGQAESEVLARECAIRDEIGSEFVELAEETLTEDDLRIAVFPLQQRRSWSELVAGDFQFTPGSLVTLLVPITEAVQLAHQAGMGHRNIDLAACLLDEFGRPWLDHWSKAIELDGVSSARADITRATDIRALGKVADAIISRSSTPAPEQLETLIAAICDGVTPSDAAARLIDALFQWAEPAPVAEGVLPGQGSRDVLGSAANHAVRALDSDEAITGDDETLLPAPVRTTRKRRLRLTALSEFGSRLSRAVAGVRPVFWALAAVVGVLIAIGALLLGSANSSAENSPSPSEAAVETSATQSPALTDEPEYEPIEPAVTEGAQDAQGEGSTGAAASAIDSVPHLIAARNECLRASNASCLDELYAPGAPGLETDHEFVTSGEDPSQRLIETDEWVVAADLGDIELISGSGSVSLSVERTAEGWRLREIWFSDSIL